MSHFLRASPKLPALMVSPDGPKLYRPLRIDYGLPPVAMCNQWSWIQNGRCFAECSEGRQVGE